MAVTAALAPAQDPGSRDLAALLAESAHAELLGPILADPAAHRLHVLLAEPVAEPVTGAGGRVELRRSRLGDPGQYFYPASSIKLCGAIALLQELNRINAEHGTAFGLDTPLTIGKRFDGDEERAVPSVAHMLRQLFLVSDNAAYNHCIEVVGADRLNRSMWAAGCESARLWHRLSEWRTLEENRQTRPVAIGRGPQRFGLPARETPIELDNSAWHDLEVGDGYMSGGKKVEGPMSFAPKNAIDLRDLQDVLVAVVRPDIATGKRGFPELTVAQRAFVAQSLGQLPRESQDPSFEGVADHHCKFVLRGARRVVAAEHLRVYDKIGRAYGFSTENAYIEDTRTGRGFFLAIVLYTNPDGILNDDRYAYEELADPVLDAIGEVVTRAVLR